LAQQAVPCKDSNADASSGRIKSCIGGRHAPSLPRRMIRENAMSRIAMAGMLVAMLAAAPATAQEVGEVGVDWLGNDIIVEAIKDPGVEGVTCHVSYFDRGVIDRLQKGNWFEDPSDTAISCRQTGPIKIGDINLGKGGEEIFSQGISLIWKEQVVNRIYDKANDTLIYLAHSRQVQDGSAKMSMTTVPLFGQEVVWKNGKPQ
jgi:CreA protein